jgi:hypothetical protein
MRKPILLLAALLVAAAVGVAAPRAMQLMPTARPDILCPNCPPGWVSSGPPLCRCTRGDD